MMTARAWIVALFCHAVLISTSLALRPSAALDTLSDSTTLIKEEDDVRRFSKSHYIYFIIAYDTGKFSNRS